MKLASIMIGASALCGAALNGLLGPALTREVWLGLLGPVAVASIEWIATEHRHRKDPQRLTSLMLGVFVGKAVFFAAYIAVILGTDLVRPVPFVASFVGFFLALLVIEGIALHRLTSFKPALHQTDLS